MRLKSKEFLLLFGIFYAFFLLLAPFDSFGTIPLSFHQGFFSLVRFDLVADDGGHYAYLRSLFFDGNIDFANEPFNSLLKPDVTGYLSNPWTIGASILWTPFFLIGHLITLTLNWLGCSLGEHGYSYPYISMLAIGSLFYSYCGLVFCVKFLELLFPSGSFFATVVTFTSSCFLYYSFIRPYSDANMEFFALSLFIYLFTFYAVRKPDGRTFFICLGISCGLLALIRFNGIIYLAIIITYLTLTIRISRISVTNIVYTLIPFLVVISVQGCCNKVLHGGMFLVSKDTTGNVVSFDIVKMKDILIGKSGLLLQCPVYLTGILGYVDLIKHHKSLRQYCYALFSGFLLQILLVSTLANYGNDYGIRYLASTIVLVMPGIARFFSQLNKTKIFLAVGLVLWQYVQVIQYKIIFDYHNFSIFKAPYYLWLILKDRQDLLLRSSNYVSLVLRGFWGVENYTDAYFLCFIPCFVAALLFLTPYILTVCKKKIAIGFVLIFFLFTSCLIVFNSPKFSQDETDRRHRLYSQVNIPDAVGYTFKMMNDNLGIKVQNW